MPEPEPVFGPKRDGVCDICSTSDAPLAQVLVVADQGFTWACEPCWHKVLEDNQTVSRALAGLSVPGEAPESPVEPLGAEKATGGTQVPSRASGRHTGAEHLTVLWRDIGWAEEGPISTCIGWHCHPALEIPGHMHEQGNEPHTHRAVVEWDMRPVPIDGADHERQ